MLKFPCLVLDHDDTAVQSEATITYPCFCETLALIRPELTISQKEYARGCSELGFVEMCKQWYGFTQKELDDEYIFWKSYSKTHIPDPVPGIREIIHKQKEQGGKVFVVSHSAEEMILRDYKALFHITPDGIYGCDLPIAKQKPSPHPILDIIKTYGYHPDQILIVDDMKPGLEMARAAGVKIAFAGWERKDFPSIYGEMKTLCDFAFDCTAELDRFLF